MSFGFLCSDVPEASFVLVPPPCFLEGDGVGVGEAAVPFVVVLAEGVATGLDPEPPFDFRTAGEAFLGSAALGCEITWIPTATRATSTTTAAAAFLRFQKERVPTAELAAEA